MTKNIVEIAISLFMAFIGLIIGSGICLTLGYPYALIVGLLSGATLGVAVFYFLQCFEEVKPPYNPDDEDWRGV